MKKYDPKEHVIKKILNTIKRTRQEENSLKTLTLN